MQIPSVAGPPRTLPAGITFYQIHEKKFDRYARIGSIARQGRISSIQLCETGGKVFNKTSARLVVRCPDQRGIVAAVSGFFYHHGANITELDQHSTDPEGGTFFTRLEFETPHLDIARPLLEEAFADTVGRRYNMDWRFSFGTDRKKMAILVSKPKHVLMELLWRWSSGELDADLTMVISNHDNLRQEVERFGVPYHHVPITRENKADGEQRILELLEGEADLVVLARYMQILSEPFIQSYRNRIINIHHSFLPAFIGANPYQKAYERGVKLVGATAHYATSDLDEGPIIEQDVARVSHGHSVKQLKRLGEVIERNVLARAVQWHLEDRLIIHDNKTVVFD